MKWGQRKERPHAITVNATPGKRVKTSGGYGHPASQDAVDAATLKRRARSSTVDSLSNAELKKLLERLDMEKRYSTLDPTPSQKTRKFLSDFLQGQGKQHMNKQAQTLAGKVGSAFK